MKSLARSLLAVLAAFTLWTCDKATPVAPSDGTLQISANPTRIDVFGVATITVIGRKADGNPVNEGTEINLSTTAGEIDPRVARANDRGVAEATLSGTGAVELATVTASSGGAAPVTVDVQIGALAASITLQATPRRIKKGGDTVDLVAQVRDDEGNPIFRALVTFESELGRLRSGGAAVETDERGTAEDQLTVNQRDIDRLDTGSILVSASVATTGGALLFADEELTVAGVPFEILLTPNPATVPDDGGQVTLNALVADDRGRGVEDQAVLFSTDLGVLASGGRQLTTDNRGEVTDVLTVTANDLGTLSPGETFTVSARTPRLVDEASETIQVTGDPIDPAGAPSQLFLTASPQNIQETNTVIALSALVLSATGVPVEATNVVFQSPDVGTLASGGGLVLTDAGGIASDSLSVTESELIGLTNDTFDVTAQAVAASGVTGTATVTVNRPLRANFEFTTANRTVTFTNRSTGGNDPLSYLWDFDDGETSTTSSTTLNHTYSSTACVANTTCSFDVKLTVTDATGTVVTAQQTVTITPTS